MLKMATELELFQLDKQLPTETVFLSSTITCRYLRYLCPGGGLNILDDHVLRSITTP